MPGSELQLFWISDAVVHSWDLATAIGVEPGLDEHLVEFVSEFIAPRAQRFSAAGWFAAPMNALPDEAPPLQRLTHISGR